MKKIFIIIPIILALAITVYIGVFYYRHLRGASTAFFPAPYPIGDAVDNGSTGPLSVPTGFKIEVFAKDLSGARVIAFDPYGNLWISRTGEGKISVVVVRNGKAEKTIDVLTGLSNPHGLLFDLAHPNTLYVAEEKKISSVQIAYVEGTTEPAVLASESMTKLVDLTDDSGIHFSRSLAYTPQGEILVSIGSSCNVCTEDSGLRASIQKLEHMGEEWKLTPYATGLRNSVFIATNPVDGKIWATEMGRDLLSSR